MSKKRRIYHALLMALEAIVLSLFIAPMTGRLYNLGNIFGLAVTVFCLAATVFWEPFCKLLKKMWSKRWGKALLAAAGALLGLLVFYAVVLSAFMIGAAVNYPKSPDAVVVLGCKVGANGNPSLMLQDRINAAYKYLSENTQVICVASGGQGADEPFSEAQVIKDGLVEKGIDPSRILLEDRSTSTRENLEFSLGIIEANGIKPGNIAIVTDSFHQLRASLIVGDMGIGVSAVNAETRFWLVPTYWVREWFALSYQFVFGS